MSCSCRSSWNTRPVSTPVFPTRSSRDRPVAFSSARFTSRISSVVQAHDGRCEGLAWNVRAELLLSGVKVVVVAPSPDAESQGQPRHEDDE